MRKLNSFRSALTALSFFAFAMTAHASSCTLETLFEADFTVGEIDVTGSTVTLTEARPQGAGFPRGKPLYTQLMSVDQAKRYPALMERIAAECPALIGEMSSYTPTPLEVDGVEAYKFAN